MYIFCRLELMYAKCIQDVHKMYFTFWQTFVYILDTNFNCHSSFNFVYIMYKIVRRNMGYILYTSCIHFVYMHQLYTSCTIFVYKMYTRFPCGNLTRVFKIFFTLTNIRISGWLRNSRKCDYVTLIFSLFKKLYFILDSDFLFFCNILQYFPYHKK